MTRFPSCATGPVVWVSAKWKTYILENQCLSEETELTKWRSQHPAHESQSRQYQTTPLHMANYTITPQTGNNGTSQVFCPKHPENTRLTFWDHQKWTSTGKPESTGRFALGPASEYNARVLGGILPGRKKTWEQNMSTMLVFSVEFYPGEKKTWRKKTISHSSSAPARCSAPARGLWMPRSPAVGWPLPLPWLQRANRCSSLEPQ